MNSRGNVEILLLLCCLVGVVAFICFAMGILNVNTMVVKDTPPDPHELTRELDFLKNEQKDKDEELIKLKAYADELEKVIREKEKELAKTKYSNKGMEQKRENLSKLEKEAEELEREIRQKEKELSDMNHKDKVNETERKQKEEELKNLKSQAEETEKRIREKEKKLAEMQVPKESPLEVDVNSLKKELEAAKRKKAELEKEVTEKKGAANTFNPWKDFKGTDILKNPLFVECKKDTIIIYPKKEVRTISDLSKDNLFLVDSQGYDGIIFLIRPDGFETFEQSFEQAKKTKLKLGYEPVDPDWKLDFSKGNQK